RGVGDVHVLATRTRRAIRVDAQVGRIDLGLFGVLQCRHAVERCERGLAPRVGVERRDPDQPVYAALPREQTVRVAALHDEGGRRDARLLAFLDLVDLEVETAPLRPT